ncbi:MAG: NAD-dependent epimerase/dehydratase family protein [Candidatus Aenigmarchaeota archaeon]|nr:NAD-dependent epimerase/dehydratase family protein [Candidatus Aenigmarchaeota archaeon]
MKLLITGGAGFIGSNLVEKLVENNEIIVIDNLSGGKKEFIEPFLDKIEFHEIDLNDEIDDYFSGVEEVWHLAANPDVKDSSPETFYKDLKITEKVLEACRKNHVKKIMFTSSSTVYGEALKNTPETCETKPISFYGATKLACESLVATYCSLYNIKGYIFRLANIIGKNSTHGVIYDFTNKLLKYSSELEILGDGKQTKSYLSVNDCLNGMIIAKDNSSDKVNIFNLGSKDWTNVKELGEIVVEEMINAELIKEKPEFKFTGGLNGKGWKGDVKEMLLDSSRLEKIGFTAENSSKEAVRKAAKEIIAKIKSQTA